MLILNNHLFRSVRRSDAAAEQLPEFRIAPSEIDYPSFAVYKAVLGRRGEDRLFAASFPHLVIYQNLKDIAKKKKIN